MQRILLLLRRLLRRLSKGSMMNIALESATTEQVLNFVCIRSLGIVTTHEENYAAFIRALIEIAETRYTCQAVQIESMNSVDEDELLHLRCKLAPQFLFEAVHNGVGKNGGHFLLNKVAWSWYIPNIVQHGNCSSTSEHLLRSTIRIDSDCSTLLSAEVLDFLQWFYDPQ